MFLAACLAVVALAMGMPAKAQPLDGSDECVLGTGTNTGFFVRTRSLAGAGTARFQANCLASDAQTSVGRAGSRLLDHLPVGQGDSAIWTIGDVTATKLDAAPIVDKGTSAVVAAGIDKIFGSQDQMAAGVGVAGLRVRSHADYRPLVAPRGVPAVRFNLDVDGVGPIGYVRYTPASGAGSAYQLSLAAAYLFLDNDSSAVFSNGFVDRVGARGGRHFVASLSGSYSRRLVEDQRFFGGLGLGVRLVDTRFDDPGFAGRTDVTAYAGAYLDREVAADVSLFALVGLEIPLTDMSFGLDPLGPADFRRFPGNFAELRGGVRVKAGRDWFFSAELSGLSGSGMTELGGWLRIQYNYDRRGRN